MQPQRSYKKVLIIKKVYFRNLKIVNSIPAKLDTD